MDIVLEITDTFLADHVYATLVPIEPTLYVSHPFETTNTTTIAQWPSQLASWEYKPATQYVQFVPSKAAYLSLLPRDNIYRQALTLWIITMFFGVLVYFGFSTLSYIFVFDKRTQNHPKFLKNQIKLEIKQSVMAIPGLAACTMIPFLLEVRGFGKFYDLPGEAPTWWYNYLQYPFFLVFTDFGIYWIHRGLHHPRVYKHLHKAHHKWIMPTPFASHAFHPLDGFAQSVPYHIFPLLFPLQKMAYVILFIFINLWTIMIHDGEYMTDNPLVNGAACHSLHHSKFEVNYGQFFTIVDRLGGTYRKPEAWMFEKEEKMSEKKWQSQEKEVDAVVKEVEGEDDRSYDGIDAKKNN